MDELHFEGDPAIDSTRRRLERVMKVEPRKKEDTRSEWKWMAAMAAGATALLFWQVRKRRKNGSESAGNGEKRLHA